MRRPGPIMTFLLGLVLVGGAVLTGTGLRDSIASDSKAAIRFHDGRPIVPVKSVRMRVTAYSPDHRSCGDQADGITASGYSVHTNAGRLVAADRKVFGFGQLLSIPGYANEGVVPVLDRGGAIKGNRLDVLYPTHERAMQWGVKHLIVTVWAYADGKPIGYKRPRGR
jgi:3D (Asp-Asp-Asp) domain-containing protein